MSAAPIMGTTSAVSNDRGSSGSSGSLGCRLTNTADRIDATRLQPPLPERKDHVEGQEGDTNAAPIVDLNAAQEAGEFVQFDEEISMRIAWPYMKSTELLDGFKIIASDSQMDG